ncbi:xanthine dehydrogenase accessory factor [Hymenobacter qilianensis]|uniref:Xanthine dehydrogenase accessory factor n=2 Tax=Hymenobacter qilianensis TaxID=1385715 RepID=A0ACB5PRK7_9BACT|nr:XdhC/CoxI family protein [Hymenobacter qilianensis]QNP52190.1 XdhC family protein [Hymenobacter qilianensis]GGF65286.1 xanthine dehydrogenase accessory factor [Hymenobacter qilianensis]
MSEIRRLLAAYDAHRAAGRACALATVVHVNGSAYRRPGARMLVTEDGQLTGAISGGCLEGDARRRARQAIVRRKPALVTYDSMDEEEDVEHGVSLGCQGIIQILLEPLDFSDLTNPIELLRACVQQEQPAVLLTGFSLSTNTEVKVGERLLLLRDGTNQGALNFEASIAAQLLEHAQQTLNSVQSATADYDTVAGTLRVFLEVIPPPVRVTVFGAGNDVQPLVRLAAGLGWLVRVVDGRPAQATSGRFPEAEEVRVLSFDELSNLPPSQQFALLMTHNYHYDLAALRYLLPTATPYIGLLGPRKKANRLLAELEAEGLQPNQQLVPRLYSPVGLNIGAETAEEIALSIVAEMQAVLKGRPGGFLHQIDGPIHEQTPVLTSSLAPENNLTVAASCSLS